MSELRMDARTAAVLAKLDHALHQRMMENVDVFVRLTPTADVGRIFAALIASGYTIHHDLRSLRAIAVTVPVGAIANLAEWEGIEGIEEAQPVTFGADTSLAVPSYSPAPSCRCESPLAGHCGRCGGCYDPFPTPTAPDRRGAT